MSRFIVYSCSKVSPEETGHDYNGNVAILASVTDPSLLLFFPITEINAKLLSFVMDEDSEFDIDTSTLGIYQTMTNSWESLDKYLSGIMMDIVYNPEVKDYVMDVKLAISNKIGSLESIVTVNFVHAVLLSVMEGIPIIVTEELLHRLAPDHNEDEDEDEDEDEMDIPRKHYKDPKGTFPKDENILNIVKKIMEAELADKSSDPKGLKEKPKEQATTSTTTTNLPKPPRKFKKRIKK